MDVREILNQLRSGGSDRQISRDLGIARQTVKRYRQWAEAHGLLAGEIPDVSTSQRRASALTPQIFGLPTLCSYVLDGLQERIK